MKKKALITGILGQDGPYLARLLIEKDYKVYGMVRRYSNPNFSNTDFLGVTDYIDFIEGDMTDESSLMNIIRTIKPDEVYNLAAQSFVGASWDLATVTTEVNSLGVLYLLNSIKKFSPGSRFYQASTSEMFGTNNTNGFQDEKTPFYPLSPYAISKVYAYWMTVNFRLSYNIFACNGILFNHESPIRGLQFVTRKITDGVARIKLGMANEIRLGNIDARRDWGYAGDYVEAIYLIMHQKKPDDYVIGTGISHSVKEFIEEAFYCAKIQNWRKYIKIDPRYKRPVDLPDLKANISKAKKELKWKPKVTFKKLVAIMVEADLKRLQKLSLNLQGSKLFKN